MRFKYFLLLTGLALILGPGAGMGQFGPPAGGFNGRGFPAGGPGQGNFSGGGFRQGGFPGGGPRQGGPQGGDMSQRGSRRGFPGNATGQADAGQGFPGGRPGPANFAGPGAGPARFPGGGTRGQSAPTFPGRAPGGAAAPGGFGGGFNPDTMAEWRFRQLDVNGDGVLSYDEMDDALKAEREKWDTNGDGFIDLNEFKEYMRARLQAYQEAAAQGGPRPDTPFPEEKKATVFRAGKLPPNLPAWFAQYDTDGDGQVGLYEWIAAGQPIAQFEAMDRNGDGFLTPDEVLRVAGGKRGDTSTPVAQAGSPGANGQPAMTPGFGRGQGGARRGFPGGGQGSNGADRGFPGGGAGPGNGRRGFPGGQ